MTLDRDELALKEALDRRRPASLPRELLERLDAIPTDVRPLRPLPVRLAIGLAPWAAIAGLILAVAAWPSASSLPSSGTTPAPSSGWDPAMTGGQVSTGVNAFPWIPSLLWFGFLATVVLTAWRLGINVETGPVAWIRWIAAGRPQAARPPAVQLASWLLAAIVVPLTLSSFLDDWDPLVYAEPGGPGIGHAETRPDGLWSDDSAEHATTTYGTGNLEPCNEQCPGPHHVYRVAPGETLTVVVSARNSSLVPVTLLGTPVEAADLVVGIARLRDPSIGSSDPSNLEPFAPVLLLPDQQVTVAVVLRAPACADPEAHPALNGPYYGVWPLVYEALGWRRQGNVWPHFSVDIAGCR